MDPLSRLYVYTPKRQWKRERKMLFLSSCPQPGPMRSLPTELTTARLVSKAMRHQYRREDSMNPNPKKRNKPKRA
jgi:hypothetical protein